MNIIFIEKITSSNGVKELHDLFVNSDYYYLQEYVSDLNIRQRKIEGLTGDEEQLNIYSLREITVSRVFPLPCQFNSFGLNGVFSVPLSEQDMNYFLEALSEYENRDLRNEDGPVWLNKLFSGLNVVHLTDVYAEY